MPRQSVPYRYDVFISYSHLDADWVLKTLLPRLENAGLTVCIDRRDFEIGIPSLINMERAVDESRHTICVLTPAWADSEWAEFESILTGTQDPAGRRRKLLPLMLKACPLPHRISALTFADFRNSATHDHEFKRLLGQIQTKALPPPTLPQDTHSPFIVGPPITHPRNFFGRTREIRRLFNLWQAPPLQNAAIIGPRRSGKTSLLLYLKNITTTPTEQLRPSQRNDWQPQPDRYRWIFVDFQDPRLGTQDGLLRALLHQLDLPAPSYCTLDYFMDVVSRSLRTPTVVLMDEIGVALQRYAELDDVFWEGLRALATNQVGGNLAFVLAAHQSPMELVQQSEHSSPFFNIFGYTAMLKPLSEAEAQALITSSPTSFDDGDVAWIYEQSQGWPITLNALCRERLLALEEGEIDEEWRVAGLEQFTSVRHLLL